MSGIASHPTLTSGLVYYNSLDGTANKVGAGTLTTTGTSLVAGKIGQGYSSPNNTSAVLVTNQSFSSATITFSVWFNPTAAPTGGNILFYLELAGSGTIQVTAFPSRIYVASVDISASEYAYGDYTGLTNITNTWRHIILEVTPNTNTVVSTLNNITLSVNAVVPLLSYNKIGLIGHSSGTNPTVFDEMGVWNRALTVAERSALYNSGAGLGYGPTVLPSANFSQWNGTVWAPLTVRVWIGTQWFPPVPGVPVISPHDIVLTTPTAFNIILS